MALKQADGMINTRDDVEWNDVEQDGGGQADLKRDDVVKDDLGQDAMQRDDATQDDVSQCLHAMAEHFGNKDMYQLTACFTSDAKSLVPGAPTQHGRNEIANGMRWASEFYGVCKMAWEMVKVDFVFPEFALLTVIATNFDRTGNCMGECKGLFMLKKINGDWKIYLHIFNEADRKTDSKGNLIGTERRLL